MTILMYLDRQSIYEGVIQSMLKDLHDVCAPSESEGIDTGYDFFGLLRRKGATIFFTKCLWTRCETICFQKLGRWMTTARSHCCCPSVRMTPMNSFELATFQNGLAVYEMKLLGLARC